MTGVKQKTLKVNNIPETNWSDDLVKIKSGDYTDSLYGISNDSFSYAASIDGKDGSWVFPRFWKCREQFHPNFFRKTKILYKSGSAETSKKIAKLLWDVETKLDLPFRTITGSVEDRPEFMWLSTNRWWAFASVRRSFFTAVLRAGVYYSADRSLQSNLNACYYLSSTPAATKLFLEGHTKTIMRTSGWYNTFYNGRYIPRKYFTNGNSYYNFYPVSEEVVKKVLVKA